MPNKTTDDTRLSHQLHVIKRGAWLVLLVAALVTGASLLLSVRQESRYQATADVFVGGETIAADLSSWSRGNPERDLSTQAKLAQLPQVRKRALSDRGLPPDAGSHLRGVLVTSSNDADILTFTVIADDPRLAPALATAYARAYTDYRRDIDTASLVAARKRVEIQLSKLRAAGVDQTSNLYLTLEQRRGEIRTVETLRGSKALLIRGASAGVKTQPKPRRNAILGGLLGIFLGIALVLLRDALNTRVRSVEEAEERLGLRLLARIPDASAQSNLPMLNEPRAAHAEAFRMLATSVDFANADVGARTIMITSANRSEGKSTILANLAAAYARRGHRVVLADLDLRRPSVATLFGIANRPGVTDVALGRVPLEEALVQVTLGDSAPPNASPTNGSNGADHRASYGGGVLEVLPSGTIPPYAGELVTSAKTTRLIEQLAGRADIVLLDAAPVLQVNDTLALSARVDALLVVARIPDTRRPMLDEVRRVLESAPIVKLGLVATGVAGDDTQYGYGYGVADGTPVPAGKGAASRRPGRARERA